MFSVTSGSTVKARGRFGIFFATTSGSLISPESDFSIEAEMRSARRISSESCSKARVSAMVSSARPSVVVLICASTMLAPAAAQAPAITASSLG